MPEYISGKKRKQALGISSYSENKDSANIIGNVLVSSGKIGVGTTSPTQDVDVQTIRIRDTVYDYTNYGGAFGYYLVKDTGGIKWVAVPPIDSNAIFVAQNNNILGVSSFTGLNIIADELLGVTTNPINPNFADITIIPRWLRSGDNGIYTTKNVGIGTTIPLADFQVGFGTTGVTIDGDAGLVTAMGYVGNYARITNLFSSGISTLNSLFVPNTLNVVGLGTTFVSTILSSAGGITTTGGDLYVGKKLFAGQIDIINLETDNINVSGIASLNQTYINSGIVTNLNVTGVSTFNTVNITGFTSTKNIFASGIVTTNTINATIGIITSITSSNASITNVVSSAATITNINITNITGIGSLSFPNGNINNFTSGIATIGILTVNTISGIAATFNSLTAPVSQLDNIIGIAASLVNLRVTGLTTLGNLTPTGITTVIGDLYVGRNLYTKGTQYFDTIGTNLLDVTGIATISNANISYQSGIAATITTINSTNVIGVAGSFNSLTVNGISTFNNGPVLVGSGTSTGTLNQPLQVTGSAYVSGNTGIGTTLPTAKLDVIGDARFTGIVTANAFVGIFSGNANTANYATLAGVSTSVIGGIGSIGQLQVTGLSTFVNGPVLIGSGTSTGTVSQRLQVTGGSYFSGNVGLGTTIATQLLDVRGGIRLNGQIFDRFNNAGDQGAVLTSDPLNSAWYWAVPPPFQVGILSALDDTVYYPTLRTTGTGNANGIGSASYLQVDSTVNTGLSYRIGPARLGIGTTNPVFNLDVYGGVRISSNQSNDATLQIDNTLLIDTTTTTVASTALTTIDSFSSSLYRSAKYQVQITQGSSYQISDILVIHDGTTATFVETASIATNDYLATFNTTISSGSLLLQVRMSSATSATIKVVRNAINV